MKVVTVLLKYDYGIMERGESLEKKFFLPAIESNCEEVKAFWLEENGYLGDRSILQNNIIKFVEKEKPNIVFFTLMKDEVTSETIEKLSRKYITINWFADDQWRFENFTRFIAPKFKYSITMDKYSLNKYKKLNCNVILSQWATFDYIDNIDLDNIKYNYDISFVGGKNITREWIIYELKQLGYNVVCFGTGWENGRIELEKIKEIYLTSKINLNLSNSLSNDCRFVGFARKKLLITSLMNIKKINIKNPKLYIKNILWPLVALFRIKNSQKNVEQIKARNFEIPGMAGFQLSQYALEIEDYFDIGKEIVVYSTVEELKKQIEYYLHNEVERKNIVKEAYKKSKDYSYEIRFKDIFREVKKCEKLV